MDIASGMDHSPAAAPGRNIWGVDMLQQTPHPSHISLDYEFINEPTHVVPAYDGLLTS